MRTPTPRSRAAILLCALLLAACVTLRAEAKAKPQPAAELLSVRDFGARGDGKADDTTAFERAILMARRTRQTVFVPRGDFRITRPLRLEAQAMVGQFAGGWPADSLPMPTLRIEQTRGAGLTLGDFSSLHGIALFYDLDTRFPAAPPPAIALAGQGPVLSSVRLQYPFDGIITAPGARPGRARLSDIFIVSPKHDGIYLTKSLDVSQMHNVEVWCNIAMSKGAGFRFGRQDDCQFSDLFAFNCDTGFLFETDTAPVEEGGGEFLGSLNNCSTDACAQGFVLRGNHRINLTNSNLYNHRIGLDVDGPNASVRLSGCQVQANGSPAIVVRNAANVSVANTLFTRAFAGDFVYVDAQNCGSFSLVGCQFKPLSPGIELGPGVQRAVVANNIFEGALPAISDHMSSAAKILAPNLSG